MDTYKAALTDKWKFFYGDVEEAWFKGFDDQMWDDVMIPHDWSVEASFSKEYSSGTAYLRGGIGWYRCHFKLPKEFQGKRIRITFDSIYKNSSIWFNSYFMGKRPSGYASITLDISEYARFGDEENVISVRVRHEDIADSRWFTGSGIVKKVTLSVSENVAPSIDGVWLDTGALLEDAGKISARISINNRIENKTDEDQKVRVRCVLEYLGVPKNRTDDEGLLKRTSFINSVNGSTTEIVQNLIKGENYGIVRESINENDLVTEEVSIELFGEATVSAFGSAMLKIDGIVDKPHLWSADIPNLYKLSTYYSIDGSDYYLVDEQKTGIRHISFDPNKGFACNGQSEKLRGVCVHDDGGVLGSAMKQEVWQRRLELLKDAGCNAIRCSHNPHMPELYDLCDVLGFYVMDEAFDEWENCKNKWANGHNVYPPRHQGYYEDFPEWHERDLLNMIYRDRRHPSIIMWSVGNEIDYPNDPYVNPIFKEFTGNNDNGKPAQEMIYNADKPDMTRLSVIARELSDIVRKADDTRTVTLAAAFPELSTKLGFIDSLDVVGYNYKEHLYEESHARFPDKTFLGSENGHGVREWKAAALNDYICGQFLWTGIDYLGEAHGWPIHGAYSGLINTAGLPKAEYYKRKSLWTSDPFIKIFTERPDEEKAEWFYRTRSWNYEEGEKVIVKCYAPYFLDPEDDYIKGVRLYINDRLVKSSSERAEDGSFRFEVAFEKGKIEARLEIKESVGDLKSVNIKETESPADNAENVQKANVLGEVLVSDAIYTSDVADHLDVAVYERIDAITGESFVEASSRLGYIYQIIVTLKDKDDTDVVFKDEEISVKASDNAQILGLDGGDLADNTDMRSAVRKTYRGRSVIFVRREDDGQIGLDITIKGQNKHIELG